MSGMNGFDKLNADQRKEISSKGGKAAWAKGTAHRFTSEQARAAAMVAVANRRTKKVPVSGVETGV